MENCKVMDSGAAEQCEEILHAVERRSDEAPDRRLVNVLLELSEEELMKELEPHEHQCNQGWEEAVCGWARVAPLASLFLAEKTDHKPRRKYAEHDSSTPVELDHLTERSTKTQWRPPTRLRSTTSSQNTWACSKHYGSNPTLESPEIPFVDGLSKTIAQLIMEDQTRDTRTPFQQQVISKGSLPDNRSPKPRKNSLKTNNALVPIKNFTFLPPINMPQQDFNKHQESEFGMENVLIIDKISRIRGTKGELAKDVHNETVSSKYRTCQHHPHYYSVSVTVPKRYHVTVSSKPETLHPAGYSVSKTLHSGTASNRQVQIHPSCMYS